MKYGYVTVTTSPTLILEPNNWRRQVIIDNQGANTVYIGHDDQIVAGQTVSLRSLEKLVFDAEYNRAGLYGVTSADTSLVAYWEAVE